MLVFSRLFCLANCEHVISLFQLTDCHKVLLKACDCDESLFKDSDCPIVAAVETGTVECILWNVSDWLKLTDWVNSSFCAVCVNLNLVCAVGVFTYLKGVSDVWPREGTIRTKFEWHTTTGMGSHVPRRAESQTWAQVSPRQASLSLAERMLISENWPEWKPADSWPSMAHDYSFLSYKMFFFKCSDILALITWMGVMFLPHSVCLFVSRISA